MNPVQPVVPPIRPAVGPNQADNVPAAMIPPGGPFVGPDGNLLPVSSRFLYDVNTHLNWLHRQLDAVNARLAAAGIP